MNRSNKSQSFLQLVAAEFIPNSRQRHLARYWLVLAAVLLLCVDSVNVDSLLQVAGEVDKAFGTLVNIMTDDDDSDDDGSHQIRH